MKKVVTLILLAVAVMVSAEDVIVTKEATKIGAKIEEVAPTEIKYKKASLPNGPMFVMPTEEILCVIFDNGEVMMFDKPKKEEEVVEQKGINLTQEEVERFDRIPRKLVALSGDYSMLYDKKALVYFDVNLDSTYIVKFGWNEIGVDEDIIHIAEYNKNHTDFDDLDFSKECENFNTYPLNSKKCYLAPLRRAAEVDKDKYSKCYKMVLKIKYLDVGSGTFSTLSLNSGTASGGAIIYGELVISDMATDKEVGRILVDRVKGQGTPYANVRLLNTISTMLVPELFHVKKK